MKTTKRELERKQNVIVVFCQDMLKADRESMKMSLGSNMENFYRARIGTCETILKLISGSFE